MGLFSASNTCFQCNKGFSDKNRYCPHCGAQIVEGSGQIFMRRVRRGSFSLILGALLTLGVVAWGLFRGARRVEAGPLVIDDMARLFRILFLTAGAGTLLFAMRKAEAWFSQGEFHALLLASLAGMSVLSASTDMLTVMGTEFQKMIAQRQSPADTAKTIQAEWTKFDSTIK